MHDTEVAAAAQGLARATGPSERLREVLEVELAERALEAGYEPSSDPERRAA